MCEELRGNFDFSQFDLVIISPLYRTLHTADLLLQNVLDKNDKEKLPKMIVDPTFAESLRCSCDVSTKVPESIKKYPYFDFSLLKGRELSWFLDNQNPKKLKKYDKAISEARK